MDIFRNPDEVIQEVEQEEKRREDESAVTGELDESPEYEEDPKD